MEGDQAAHPHAVVPCSDFLIHLKALRLWHPPDRAAAMLRIACTPVLDVLSLCVRSPLVVSSHFGCPHLPQLQRQAVSLYSTQPGLQQQQQQSGDTQHEPPQLTREELSAIRLRIFGEPSIGRQRRPGSSSSSRSSSKSSVLPSLRGRELSSWYASLQPPLPMMEDDLETK